MKFRGMLSIAGISPGRNCNESK